ncbi:putative ejection protein [Caudoviricetes sp.]|nr:putative ejection protein [Caudoviricetes sp.]
MVWGAIAGVVGSVLGGALKSKGERKAATIQANAAQQGIDEFRSQLSLNEQRQLEAQRANRDFQLSQMDYNRGLQLNNLNKFTGQVGAQQDYVKSLFNPYSQGGTNALQAQQNLLGLGGADAQSAAIAQLNNSPYMQELMKQGESAILQNASATGGLRGGNTQGALAQFRPGMLNQLIQQQYANLGGLSAMGFNANSQLGQYGQNATAMLGEAQQRTAENLGSYGQNVANQLGAYGQNMANQLGAAGVDAAGGIAGLLGGKGQAQAGGKLSQYGFAANLPGLISGNAGFIKGVKGLFGGL